MKFKIALLQILPVEDDLEFNLRKGLDYCMAASQMDVDLILFPEMWSIGYSTFEHYANDPASDLWKHPDFHSEPQNPGFAGIEERRKKWLNSAISSDSSFILQFREMARKIQTNIAITYLEKKKDEYLNSVSIIDRHGCIAMTYSKIHTCCFCEPEASLTPGDAFTTCEIETKHGNVKIGTMICFDREFPESARILMLQGAEIIIVPNACELEIARLSQIRTRAFENLTGIAVCNYPEPKVNGHSIAFHPCAFDEDGKSRETLIVEASESEGIFIAEFDMDDIRACRKREVWGAAFRRPDRYRMLISNPEIEVFKREKISD
jgi:N-carbamoylputrescine amidase